MPGTSKHQSGRFGGPPFVAGTAATLGSSAITRAIIYVDGPGILSPPRIAAPNDYVLAVARALEQYRDGDLAAGENILDSWGLMQICFRHHASLDFQATAVVLKEGRGLGELTPSPRFPDAWRQPSATEVLLSLVTRSIALVRVWSMQLLRREHRDALADRPPDSFAPFLEHDDDEVQQFGAELFGGSRGLDKLPIPSWLSLLQTKVLPRWPPSAM